MSIVNKSSLMSLFQMCTSLILLSCLIALAQFSSTMLKRNGIKGYPCLISDCKRKVASFSPVSRYPVGFLVGIHYWVDNALFLVCWSFDMIMWLCVSMWQITLKIFYLHICLKSHLPKD
jgi:hypothetical protein